MRAQEMYVSTKGVLAELTDYAMEKVKNFTVVDFAVMKICLSTTGMLLGIAFSKTLKKIAPLLAIISVATYVYLVFKMFIEEN